MVFGKEDQPKVKDGLKECKKRLDKYKKQMDTFFKTVADKGYNDEMLLEYFKKNNPKYPVLCTGKCSRTLQMVARFYEGKQIDKCIEDDGYCSFEAEL